MYIVLGLGKSGIAAAKWLLGRGLVVRGIDDQLIPSRQEEIEREMACERFDITAAEAIDWSCVEQCIVSPGISPSHSVYKRALQEGISIKTEVELALGTFNHQTLVGITGTNGKTTVALLVEHILNCSGKKAKALGNVGRAACDYALGPKEEEVLVVELSSYQLETMTLPVFDVAILLNLTPDHLERYDSLQGYALAKSRLGALVKKENPFFVSSDVFKSHINLFKEPLLFGWDPSCAFWTDGRGLFKNQKQLFSLSQTDHSLAEYECENIMAAWAICDFLGVSEKRFIEALDTFKKPPHRIEWIRTLSGVDFYDDSKGTNVEATSHAVKSMKGFVILIAGGVDKGFSYASWKRAFKGRVKQIITLGQAAEKIEQEMGGQFPTQRCHSLQEAVSLAAELASQGDNVLLSPGSSSFDMFSDYIHRGKEFQKCVHLL